MLFDDGELVPGAAFEILRVDVRTQSFVLFAVESVPEQAIVLFIHAIGVNAVVHVEEANVRVEHHLLFLLFFRG